jgi:squalene synthase HpnC
MRISQYQKDDANRTDYRNFKSAQILIICVLLTSPVYGFIISFSNFPKEILKITLVDKKIEILAAYKSAMDLAKNHYENFPVVSLLIPNVLRKHIAIIYWFSRTADDFADEGNSSEGDRLDQLNEFENSLNDLLKGKFKSPFEEALYQTIEETNLTVQPFYDLLAAFKQDIVKKRYNNFSEVLDYCKQSANPIGRLLLELFDIRSDEAFKFSDKICTALQMTNFYQDIEIDYRKGRIYFPEDEMNQFEVTENMFALKENSVNLKKLLKYNIDRTQTMFDQGRNLLKYLNGRLNFEIKWTILGGEAILQKIRKNNYKIFNARPHLTKSDLGALFIRSFLR